MPAQFNHDLCDRDDGLDHCKVCGGGEGSLPTHCPGIHMTEDQQDKVYAGELNFAIGPMDCGRWWIPLD